MADDFEGRRVPIFIAYRQGVGEGDAAAAWIYTKLKGRSIPVDGQRWLIDTYWDQTAPAVDDWREVWEGHLRTARAMILVCTPGTAKRRDGSDWFYEEVSWWVDNRDVGPIIVNASDLDPAPVPSIVTERWGFAQWVKWLDDELAGERALSRIVEGIVLAQEGVRHQELERTLRLLHEAEIARLDALAALNKAEALRIGSMPDPGESAADERQLLYHKELLAVGRKYERQMNALADQADGLRRRGPPEPTRQLTGTAPPRKVFTLEAIQADLGSCILVRYGTADRERFVLIDGGPVATYRQRLRPRLIELQRRWAGDGPLELEAVISTQADEPESGGIRCMLEELHAEPAGSDAMRLNIRRFWTNVFDPYATNDLARRPAMSALRIPHLARRLGLPVNAPFDRFVSRPILGAPRVEFTGGLTVTVLGPRGDFSRFWVREVERTLQKYSAGDIGVPRLQGVIETCSSDKIYLQPSPVRISNIDPGRGDDRSERNRSSIVLLLEYAQRSVLLTSDAVGSDVVSALAETGRIAPNGSFEVDLLSVPHYGSRLNVDPIFFERVKAARYLVQCSTRRFQLPSPATVAMLASARGREAFTLYLTHRGQAGGERGDAYLAQRDRVLTETQRAGEFSVVFGNADTPALVIDLLAEGAPPQL